MIPTLALAAGANAQLLTNLINEYDQGAHLAHAAASSLARRWMLDRQDSPVIEPLASTLRWALWSGGATGGAQDGPAVTDDARIARVLGERDVGWWLRLLSNQGLALFALENGAPKTGWTAHDQARGQASAAAFLDKADGLKDHQALAVGMWHCLRRFAAECFYGTNNRLLHPLRAMSLVCGVPLVLDPQVRKGMSLAGASGFTSLEMTQYTAPSFAEGFAALYVAAQFAAGPEGKILADAAERSKQPALRTQPLRALEVVLHMQGRKERKVVEFKGWRDQWQVDFLGFAKLAYHD